MISSVKQDETFDLSQNNIMRARGAKDTTPVGGAEEEEKEFTGSIQ